MNIERVWKIVVRRVVRPAFTKKLYVGPCGSAVKSAKFWITSTYIHTDRQTDRLTETELQQQQPLLADMGRGKRGEGYQWPTNHTVSVTKKTINIKMASTGTVNVSTFEGSKVTKTVSGGKKTVENNSRCALF